jgi:hypothetical protein
LPDSLSHPNERKLIGTASMGRLVWRRRGFVQNREIRKMEERACDSLMQSSHADERMRSYLMGPVGTGLFEDDGEMTIEQRA